MCLRRDGAAAAVMLRIGAMLISLVGGAQYLGSEQRRLRYIGLLTYGLHPSIERITGAWSHVQITGSSRRRG